jgi:hypothetical protein
VLCYECEFDGAIAEYREVVRLDPDNSHTHYHLGLALEANGDWDGAIAEYLLGDQKIFGPLGVTRLWTPRPARLWAGW